MWKRKRDKITQRNKANFKKVVFGNSDLTFQVILSIPQHWCALTDSTVSLTKPSHKYKCIDRLKINDKEKLGRKEKYKNFNISFPLERIN